jgi:hypothetical protein
MYSRNESTLGVNSQKDRLSSYYGDFSPNYFGKDLAKFTVPDWGDKVNYGAELSYRPSPGYLGWRARTTTLCRSCRSKKNYCRFQEWSMPNVLVLPLAAGRRETGYQCCTGQACLLPTRPGPSQPMNLLDSGSCWIHAGILRAGPAGCCCCCSQMVDGPADQLQYML